MTTAERIEALRDREQALQQKLTGASRGLNRPALSKELATIRRQIAMLTEDTRPRQPIPEPLARAYR